MNTFSLVYFQAAATIIPTLLIAVAIGSKRAIAIANVAGSELGNLARIALLATGCLVGLSVIAAEMSALVCIATGKTSLVAGSIILGVISLLLVSVVFELFIPILMLLSVRAIAIAMAALTLAVGATGYFLGQLIGSGA